MTHIDHPSHAPHSVPDFQPFPDRLYVVTCISNPARYRSRYQHYRAFEKHVADAGAILYTVEMAFGGRPFEVTEATDPRDIQVRGADELWHKENLLNIGIGRLPREANYIATVDADLTFVRPDWAQETLHQLQHCPVVQMFSEISNLGPSSEFMGHGLGFVEAWKRGATLRTRFGEAKSDLYWHGKRFKKPDYPTPNSELGSPGGAWAYRREALDKLGGLIDWSLVGAADYFMAAGLFGLMELVLAEGYHAAFAESLLRWQGRADRHVRRNVGVVPGLILHNWHGKMSERGYGERWKLLIKHAFDPEHHLKRDSQGLLRLEDDGSERYMRLRDDLRSYIASRNEDSVDS